MAIHGDGRSTMQQRRGTAAEWTAANPVLFAGEIGWETDTNKLKIGDGTTAWNSLDYFGGGGGGAHADLTGLDADDHTQYATDTDLTNHAAAGDPHTGYRLESADHTHASSGIQGGQVDHGALGGLADDDHPQYATNTEFDDHSARHEDGGADEISIAGLSGTPAALTAHEGDTSTHGVAEVAGVADITFETLDAAGDVGTGANQLSEGDHSHPGGGSTVDVEEDNAAVGTASTLDFGTGFDLTFGSGEAEIALDLGEVSTFTDHSARHENGGADEISIAGLDGTPTELTNHAGAADPHTGYLKESDLAGQHDHSADSAAGGGGDIAVGLTFALSGEGDFTDTGAQNNLTPTDWATKSVFQWKGGSSLTINGLTAQPAGTIKIIHHEGTGIILLSHEAGGSTAANRLDLPLNTSFTLNQGEAVILEYNGDQSRWKVVGHSAGGDLTSHLDDSSSHLADTITIADAGGDFTATHVEGALAELQADNEAHVAAGDPHTGYRLETADHTHASTGAQAGQLDHGTALTGLSDDDHPQYVLESAAVTFTVGGVLTGAPPSNGFLMLWRAPFACTVTQVRSHFDAGTNCVVNARKNQASDFMSADFTNSTANAWGAGTVNQNQSIAAGDDIEIELVSTSGAVTEVNIQVELTRNLP